MDPGEGASAWQRKSKGRGLVRPTTTDRPMANPSILAFGGLPKPAADSLLARRISLRRPPPTTMNHGDDSSRWKRRFQNRAWAYLNRLRVQPTKLIRTSDDWGS